MCILACLHDCARVCLSALALLYVWVIACYLCICVGVWQFACLIMRLYVCVTVALSAARKYALAGRCVCVLFCVFVW